MIIRNKKNGTNILAFQNTSIVFKAHETINIPSLTSFEQITNKSDFINRGWFEIVDNTESAPSLKNKETNLEKAKKEVKEYSKDKKNKEDKE